MQFAAEQPREGKWVERYLGRKFRGAQAAGREMSLPLLETLIVVGQRDAVGAIADPVHEVQRGMI